MLKYERSTHCTCVFAKVQFYAINLGFRITYMDTKVLMIDFTVWWIHFSSINVPVHLQKAPITTNIFWPFHLVNTKLGAGVALNEPMIPIDFQVYREDKREFCTTGGIDVSETFLVFPRIYALFELRNLAKMKDITQHSLLAQLLWNGSTEFPETL